jgi:biopolymer transport protein ExbD
MRILIVFIFFLFTHHIKAQQDSLSVIISNTWTTKKPSLSHWLDSDTLILKSTNNVKIKVESIETNKDFSVSEIREFIKQGKKDRQYIHFNKDSTISHDEFISCPVGETLYNLKQYEYNQNKLLLTYFKWE